MESGNDISKQYTRMKHRDHVRKRPDTYIGSSLGFSDKKIWLSCLRNDGSTFCKFANTRLAMSVISISKEIFDNATDNVERSRVEGLDPGIIQVFMTPEYVTVRNFGKPIPTDIHPEEKMPLPQMLFGELLTSDNYDDTIDRHKIGRNGYGSKLTNIFSKFFQVKIGNPYQNVLYTQVWQFAMSECSAPTYEPYQGQAFTEITFIPDFGYLYGDLDAPPIFTEHMDEYFRNRAMEMSFAAQVVTEFQGQPIDCRDGLAYFYSHFAEPNPEMKIARYVSDDGNNEMIVGDTPGEGWAHAFVNGTPVNLGEHVNEYLRVLFARVTEHFDKKFNKKLTVNIIKKNVSILLRVKLDKPTFDAQIKNKLEKPRPKVSFPVPLTRALMEWEFMEAMMKHFRVGGAKKKKVVGIEKFWNPKYEPANMSKGNDPSERLKCRLILTEGDTGKTLAEKGTAHLPGGKDYNGMFPLRGKLINAITNSEAKVEANRETSTILKILNADTTVDYYKEPNACLNLRYGGIILLMDADDDGYHITGLVTLMVYTLLKSLLPLGFVTVLYTPVIEGLKKNERMTFLFINQHKQWMKENDASGWKFNYKKGLGSWNTDPKTIEKLFKNPAIVSFVPDNNTYDMIELAFHKDCSDQRKEWIADYDPDEEIIITNPRPISHFLNNDFRGYSKAAVVRAIPRLMDGMKPSNRKVLYAAFKKFPSYKKEQSHVKMVQFAGYVMEKSGYHHGDASLYKTIMHMGHRYLTGPNNIPVIEGEGNFGDRYLKGKDASHARYLKLKLSKISYLIYPKEDFPLMTILEEDGEKVEPLEMYPIIPMALVNKIEGIATGWSTKIQPHNPHHLIQWIREWIAEKKDINNHADYDNYQVNVASKKTLVPWYREWRGNLIRVRNQPYEVYRVEGKYHMEGNTVVIDEIPVEMSLDQYKNWGEKIEQVYLTEPQNAYFRTFATKIPAPFVKYHITGCGIPDLKNLNLVSTMSMSNMVLIDKENRPRHYDYVYMIMCEWCLDRYKIYIRRKEHMLKLLVEEVRIKTLKYRFIMDLIENRLTIKGKDEKDYIPYMLAQGYPCGKKNMASLESGIEDEEDDLEKTGINAKGVNQDFRRIPVGMQDRKNADKLARDVQIANNKMFALQNTAPEDMWLEDLAKLEKGIEREFSRPLY